MPPMTRAQACANYDFYRAFYPPDRCGSYFMHLFAHVDHDEDTGIVRALLCGPCNRGIGIFKHDAGLLREAADYVEYHQRPKEKAA
jgi:hypothetical protein